MAGIFRHLIIACIFSMLIFLLFFGRIGIFPLALFILGNVIPDATFLPSLIFKYKTLNPEKLLKTRMWKILAPLDEIIMFLIFLIIFFIYPSFDTSAILIGILDHIFIDLFLFEENVWW